MEERTRTGRVMRVKGVKSILSVMLLLLSIRCDESREAVMEQNELAADVPTLRVQNCSDDPPSHTGVATYYTWADGSGNCSFDPTPNDLMVAAMNHIDYAGSAVCGSSVSIIGPKGRVTVRIVDQCGDCPQGHIDLSPLAFSRIADLSAGIVPIKWRYVASAVQGNIIYHFKNGSNQWWTAVQIRNHRYPVARFEYMDAQGAFKTVRRQTYNYFVEPIGMGPGPYTFRVTDVHGHVLIDTGVPHTENGNVSGTNQFPPCNSLSDEQKNDQ